MIYTVVPVTGPTFNISASGLSSALVKVAPRLYRQHSALAEHTGQSISAVDVLTFANVNDGRGILYVCQLLVNGVPVHECTFFLYCKQLS